MATISICRGKIIKGIVIDVAVPSIEAVVARPGAAVAPIRKTPRWSYMPSAVPVTRPEVRSLRGNSAGKNGRRNRGGKDRSLHGDTH